MIDALEKSGDLQRRVEYFASRRGSKSTKSSVKTSDGTVKQKVNRPRAQPKSKFRDRVALECSNVSYALLGVGTDENHRVQLIADGQSFIGDGDDEASASEQAARTAIQQLSNGGRQKPGRHVMFNKPISTAATLKTKLKPNPPAKNKKIITPALKNKLNGRLSFGKKIPNRNLNVSRSLRNNNIAGNSYGLSRNCDPAAFQPGGFSAGSYSYGGSGDPFKRMFGYDNQPPQGYGNSQQPNQQFHQGQQNYQPQDQQQWQPEVHQYGQPQQQQYDHHAHQQQYPTQQQQQQQQQQQPYGHYQQQGVHSTNQQQSTGILCNKNELEKQISSSLMHKAGY